MNGATNLQTPRRLGVRPSLVGNVNTTSTPNLSAAAAVARKASLQALTGSGSSTKMGGGGGAGGGSDIQVGDTVDVPGGMHGTAKFIGTIAGKNGTFLGVELAKQYSHKGKNDGDVDGVRYFATSVPNAGIFLPLHRASRRESIYDEFPATPTTPSHGSDGFPGLTSPRGMPMFSQSVGPGARPPSPNFKPRQQRPSLPRPESPLRKVPNLAPTPGKLPSLSKSTIGTPRNIPSPGPMRGVPKTRTPGPYSRNNSRAGMRGEESTETTPTPAMPTRSSDGSAAGSGVSAGSAFTPAARRSQEDGSEEIKRLKLQLQERDRQLKEQATSLADMESALTELENMKGLDELGGHNRNGSGGLRDADTVQLRAIVREKNERIAMLTAEFDAHRADFRSTIDTLEMASTETERVYEKKVEELLAELRELQANHEEVTGVTQQMKQVEEMVAELEEGLEDARRGEAEARAEVEFLRGEVERTRAELKQEREKSAEALKNAEAAVGSSGPDTRDKEQMQDEIRGLRAIIHSLSSGGGSPVAERPAVTPGVSDGMSSEEQLQMKSAMERLQREKKELEGLIERKNYHQEQLEREVEQLKGNEAQRGSVISNSLSDRTTTNDKRSSARDSKGTVVNWRGSSGRIEAMAPMTEIDTHSVSTGSGVLWCEICETSGHDILTCSSIDKDSSHGGNAADNHQHQDMEKISKHMQNASISSLDPDKPKPLAMSLHKKPSIPNMSPAAPPAVSAGAPPNIPLPNPYKMNDSVAAGKDGTRDPTKWCALCERDGHDSINCSFEDQFD